MNHVTSVIRIKFDDAYLFFVTTVHYRWRGRSSQFAKWAELTIVALYAMRARWLEAGAAAVPRFRRSTHVLPLATLLGVKRAVSLSIATCQRAGYVARNLGSVHAPWMRHQRLEQAERASGKKSGSQCPGTTSAALRKPRRLRRRSCSRRRD